MNAGGPDDSKGAVALGDLGHYVRWVADAMHLRDWTVLLQLANEEPPGADLVCVSGVPGRRVAVMHLPVPAFFDDAEPEARKRALVRGLARLHFAGLRQHARRLERPLGPYVAELFLRLYDDQLDRGIDGLASALADLLPTYEEWDAARRCAPQAS